MQLTFRQGIARYQTDAYSTPTFLRKSGDFIDLIVSPDPTIIIFAHRSSTYVIEESKTVLKAWGPFTGNSTRYLYWDINLLDASLTRSFTMFPPIVSSSAPNNVPVDQHWYDTTLDQMKVWNGSKWLDKLRVFAATYSSQAIIQGLPLGSQVGEVGSFEGGSIMLDSFGKPIRQSDGTFVSSATSLSAIGAATNQIKLAAELVFGMAEENIAKFSFVQSSPSKQLKLARSDQWKSRVVGIVTEDLYTSEVGNIFTSGLLSNDQWNWTADNVGRPVFCGKNGEVTLTAPTVGVLQIVGYVYNANSIVISIQNVTILDDITRTIVVLPTGEAPVSQFTATPVNGTAPLTVQFRSTSLHAPLKWEWDFTNSGKIDSTIAEPSYTYTQPGTYAVRLKTTNEFGSDVALKTSLITVSAPVAANANTNLSINFNADAQVGVGETIPVTVTISNAGLLTATNVVRTIVIEDIAGVPVVVTAKPTGATVTNGGGVTILLLPIVPSLQTGQNMIAAFSLAAPKKAGLINMRAGVLSPEKDITLGDNVAAMSIRVK